MDRSDDGQPQTLKIDSLTYGPHGIGRLEGKAIFVRGAAPGEVVEVAIREDKGRFAYADILNVRKPSPRRRATPCPYLPPCGGCPWQHLDYSSQLSAKEQNVRDAFQRIGGFEDIKVDSIIPSPDEFNYRSRINLRIADGRLGFYAAGKHDLVPDRSMSTRFGGNRRDYVDW